MAITLRITCEDVADRLLTYNVIRIYRAATLTGAYTVQGTVALVAGTYHYSYSDATGTLNHYYKYSFYHTVTTAESALSDPFRVEGVTRLRIRQAALNNYGAGVIFINTGVANDTVITSDYRIKSAVFRANRGKGTWLLVSAGASANVGSARIISASVPSTGTFTISPVWGAVMANGDEVEWHTLADPDVWAAAINRGLARYWYVDRVPLVGVDNQEEYSLAALPWLNDRDQIHDVRWYPTSTTDIDESYVGDGRWWNTRQDGDALTLIIYPTITTSDVLYLEASRPMPALYTDSAALPNIAAEDLAAALAYDEVLAYLSSPGSGTTVDIATWTKARILHSVRLRKLFAEHRPKPRHGPAKLPWPPVVPSQFKAR